MKKLCFDVENRLQRLQFLYRILGEHGQAGARGSGQPALTRAAGIHICTQLHSYTALVKVALVYTAVHLYRPTRSGYESSF